MVNNFPENFSNISTMRVCFCTKSVSIMINDLLLNFRLNPSGVISSQEGKGMELFFSVNKINAAITLVSLHDISLLFENLETRLERRRKVADEVTIFRKDYEH